MEHKKNIPWWLIITMLVFFWPVGLVLMFIKIFGDDEGQKRTTGRKNNGYRMDKSYTDVPFTSSDGEIGATLKPKQLKKMFSLTKGKLLRNIGLVLTFLGGLASVMTFIGTMLDYYWLTEALMISSMVFLGIGAPGLALTFWGQSILGKAQRYSRYARLIGDSSEVSLDRMAGAMGVDFDKVCSDLQKMLDGGCFEGYYVDIERRILTRGRLDASMPRQQAQTRQHEAPKAEEAPRRVHPADQIHAINENIRQAEVAQKITRLEALTRRIYNYTEAYPEKEKLARSFKERYLPKTIKILESYSRFEQSGSSGENVRAAMKDVEAVLDVLISSFEKQLDMLYMDEALDISTDIDALESMLAGDGLGQSPFAMEQGME
ncbi:MAG: 5-bromo-4-chloroindolyl phosphate hydrolysis family protein [Clostridia bacterium]|nr:5-bromo-4-chloroindolyl phosphate hydrolysis family protein [Clostridia bacterium]